MIIQWWATKKQQKQTQTVFLFGIWVIEVNELPMLTLKNMNLNFKIEMVITLCIFIYIYVIFPNEVIASLNKSSWAFSPCHLNIPSSTDKNVHSPSMLMPSGYIFLTSLPLSLFWHGILLLYYGNLWNFTVSFLINHHLNKPPYPWTLLIQVTFSALFY